MRRRARLASSKLTLLPRSSTTSRTTHSEHLFWPEFFFHAKRDNALKPSTGMVNVEQFQSESLLQQPPQRSCVPLLERPLYAI